MVNLTLLSVTTDYDVDNKTIFAKQYYKDDNGSVFCHSEFLPLESERVDKLSFEIPQKVLDMEFQKVVDKPL